MLLGEALVEIFQVSPETGRLADKHFFTREIVGRGKFRRCRSRHSNFLDASEKLFAEIDFFETIRRDRQDTDRDVASSLQQPRVQLVARRRDEDDVNADVLTLSLVVLVDFVLEGLEELVFGARLPNADEPVRCAGWRYECTNNAAFDHAIEVPRPRLEDWSLVQLVFLR